MSSPFPSHLTVLPIPYCLVLAAQERNTGEAGGHQGAYVPVETLFYELHGLNLPTVHEVSTRPHEGRSDVMRRLAYNPYTAHDLCAFMVSQAEFSVSRVSIITNFMTRVGKERCPCTGLKFMRLLTHELPDCNRSSALVRLISVLALLPLFIHNKTNFHSHSSCPLQTDSYSHLATLFVQAQTV